VKTATIYERDGKLYPHSNSETTVGPWVMSGPVSCTSKGDAREIGRLIREGLAASRGGIPHSEALLDEAFDRMLDLAGVDSYATFIQSTKCVEIETEDNKTVTFVPTRK
jgi:hypothetical protein